MNKEEIELGDVVEDIYTGMKGTAVAKTEFINGCTQFSVAQRAGKKAITEGTVLLEQIEMSIDSKSLKVIKKKLKPKPIPQYKSTGGPSRRMMRRNY